MRVRIEERIGEFSEFCSSYKAGIKIFLLLILQKPSGYLGSSMFYESEYWEGYLALEASSR